MSRDLLHKIVHRHSETRLYETSMGDVVATVVADDGAEDDFCTLGDDERAVVLDLIDEIKRIEAAVRWAIEESGVLEDTAPAHMVRVHVLRENLVAALERKLGRPLRRDGDRG